MAIKSNKKIDFEYEHESNDQKYVISLRLHESAEYGPSIGLLDENGEVAANFPVAMFPEITEFLVTQGVIEGRKSSPQLPRLPLAKPAPSVGSSKPSLPKPRVVSSKPSVNPLRPTTVAGHEVVPVDIEGEGDETAEEATLRQIREAMDGSNPAMSLSVDAEQSPTLSEEENNAIMAERTAAAAKAKSAPSRKIKKLADSEDE